VLDIPTDREGLQRLLSNLVKKHQIVFIKLDNVQKFKETEEIYQEVMNQFGKANRKLIYIPKDYRTLFKTDEPPLLVVRLGDSDIGYLFYIEKKEV